MIINYDMMFSGWLSHIESQPGGRQREDQGRADHDWGVSTRCDRDSNTLIKKR
jgi:hypothetical protein